MPTVLIVLLAVIVFANSFPGDYILDDPTVIFDNPLIANLEIGRIFLTDYWGPDFNSGLYRPLVILSFALKQAFLGPAPWGDHLINVVLHALVCVLIWKTLLRWDVPRGIAWLTAAIFAVHPIHTEVVNVAVGRSELLVALGVFVALYAAKSKREYSQYVGVAGGFVLAALSKENAIVLLALFPLLDGFRCRNFRNLWRERRALYLMLSGLTLAWLAFRTWGVQRWVPVGGLDKVYTPLPFMEPLERFLTALQIQWLYLYKQLVPIGLQGIYSGDGYLYSLNSLWSPVSLLLLMASLGLLLLGLWLYHRGQWAGLAILLYAVAFAPTSNIFFLTGVTMAERLAYLPSVWFCLSVAAFLVLWGEQLERRWIRLVVVILLLGLFSGLTLSRNRDFNDNLRLWQADTRRDPQNVMAWFFMAAEYWAHGEISESDAAFQRMVQLSPDFGVGLTAYAGFLREQNRPQEALSLALRAREDRNADPLLDLTTANIYLDLGNLSEAKRWLEEARWIVGTEDNFRAVEGKILEAEGKVDDALATYQRIDTAKPIWRIHERMAAILLRQGRFAEAEKVLNFALQSNATSEMWNSLGIALFQQGKSLEAKAAFSKAIQLAPDVDGYRKNYERIQ